MLFKKRKHPLPKFPSSVAETFRKLCEVLNEEDILELKQIVLKNREVASDLKAENDAYDLESADKLTEACLYLLEHYFDFRPEKQKLVVGAVRYFAVSDDPFSDATFASGFHDDKCIVNYVLEELNIHDRYLPTM